MYGEALILNTPTPEYSRGHDLANSIIHGVGTLLSIAGLSILVVFASLRATVWHIVSCSIYGTTLVLLYASSTLYHAFRSPRVKKVLRAVDHASIYLLIAGSYTPFTLVTLRGAWGWSLFGVVWALALVGITLSVFFTGRFRIISTLVYAGMGWMVVIAIRPLTQHMPPGGTAWLLAGGLAYTFGIVFYLWKRLPFHHAIWHLFVLAGSLCQFFAIMFYVVLYPT